MSWKIPSLDQVTCRELQSRDFLPHLKFAVTDLLADIRTVQVAEEPLHAPLHEENLRPLIGCAVSFTLVLTPKEALAVLQDVPQLIPAGELVTVP